MKKPLSFFILLLFLFPITKIYSLSLEEKTFYNKQYDKAIKEMRNLVKKSKKKDKLLYLMNTGIIFHTKGDYEKSNLVFKDAETLADKINISISKQTLSFFLSDRNANFRGENFERVLIKFYIALNYLDLNQPEMAKKYFKKLNFDLKNMKFSDSTYKQNFVARYLDAIVSENLGQYNDARVEYKNIEMLSTNKNKILPDRYILAYKENDINDMNKFSSAQKNILAFDENIQPITYSSNLGELVIIYEAGRGPKKMSRGKLMDDKTFALSLRAAIEVALNTRGAALSTTAVVAMLGTAENPIPFYKKQKPYKSLPITISLNKTSIGKTQIFNNYSETAIHNFNDHYPEYISKNVTSIATKIVLAAIAANALSKKAESLSGNNPLVSGLGRVLIGAGAGKTVAATIKPDLRCWNLLPSNFQIMRIFLKPGEYSFNVSLPKNSSTSPYPEKIEIKKGDVKFINLRSF